MTNAKILHVKLPEAIATRNARGFVSIHSAMLKSHVRSLPVVINENRVHKHIAEAKNTPDHIRAKAKERLAKAADLVVEVNKRIADAQADLIKSVATSAAADYALELAVQKAVIVVPTEGTPK